MMGSRRHAPSRGWRAWSRSRPSRKHDVHQDDVYVSAAGAERASAPRCRSRPRGPPCRGAPRRLVIAKMLRMSSSTMSTRRPSQRAFDPRGGLDQPAGSVAAAWCDAAVQDPCGLVEATPRADQTMRTSPPSARSCRERMGVLRRYAAPAHRRSPAASARRARLRKVASSSLAVSLRRRHPATTQSKARSAEQVQRLSRARPRRRAVHVTVADRLERCGGGAGSSARDEQQVLRVPVHPAAHVDQRRRSVMSTVGGLPMARVRRAATCRRPSTEMTETGMWRVARSS